jgi:hypothetical protein
MFTWLSLHKRKEKNVLLVDKKDFKIIATNINVLNM